LPTITPKYVLTGIAASEIMRRQVISISAERTVADGIRRMIKYRSNAIVVTDQTGAAAGIVSKTDTMMAYYGGVPTETRIEDIMMGPLHTCFTDDTLASALSIMQDSGIHQLYVIGASGGIDGVITYGDIVGLVYRYCRHCERSRRRPPDSEAAMPTLRVTEVMSTPVTTVQAIDTIATTMDILSAQRLGAVVVIAPDGSPKGVISKTDLALAYLHGNDIEEQAAAVMTAPVTLCTAETLLSSAIQSMLLRDIQRIFVTDGEDGPLTGVLSLSDAARFRSGTCRACTTSRLMTA
jgi:CBS domain-containing protein